jgi:hypothetical protein
MGFTLDFWEETTSYRPGWQAGNRRKASVPAQFIRVLTGNLADLFSGLVDVASPWFMETFDEKCFCYSPSYASGCSCECTEFGKHQSSPTRDRGTVEHHYTIARSCRVSSLGGMARILIATSGGGE